jgi:MurNAc alpha-1-phosphate uridylyltransferase
MTAPKSAMVLAAGLGTRMKPLTDKKPKALVEVAGRALIDRVIDRLEQAGVLTVVINVHHHADALEKHLKARASPKIEISDERAHLLDSGGGVKKALALLGKQPFFVMNADTIWIEGL